MLILKVVALAVAGAGLVSAAFLMVRIAILARRLPDLPLSMRINPLSVLASRQHWTPQIAALERKATGSIAAFICGVLLFVVTAMFGSGR